MRRGEISILRTFAIIIVIAILLAMIKLFNLRYYTAKAISAPEISLPIPKEISLMIGIVLFSIALIALVVRQGRGPIDQDIIQGRAQGYADPHIHAQMQSKYAPYRVLEAFSRARTKDAAMRVYELRLQGYEDSQIWHHLSQYYSREEIKQALKK